MAHVIKLKHGSPAAWSYIDLTGSDYGNVDYYPGTPDEGASEIVESGRWRIAGSSVADLIAKIGPIERLFFRAGVFAEDEIGARQVWLTILPDGTSDTWESQIFEGKLELTEDILGVDWANRSTEVILYWRRSGWWQRGIDVPVANDNGTATTAGVKIYNWNDKTGSAPNKVENYVDIVAADVPGDMPAQAVIEIFCGTGAVTDIYDRALILHNALTLPSTFVYWQEGETGSGDVTDTTRSADKYHNYVLAAGVASKISLDFSALDMINGAWFRTLLSSKFTGTIKARAFLEINGAYYYGPYSILTNAGTNFLLSDLGMLRMPPIKTIYGGFVGHSVSKCGVELLSAGGLTISVDYFLATPIDSFGQAIMDGDFGGAVNNLIVDFHSNNAYILDGTTGDILNYGTVYGGIFLEPNLNQRLIFKFTKNGIDTVGDTATIFIARVYAYVRKRTI